MAGIAKRFGFGRTDASTTVDLPTTKMEAESRSGSGSEKDLKDQALATGIDVSNGDTELEANRRIKDLKNKHQWDPNLPSDTLADLDEARHAHDLQSELTLVDAFAENSPYPQVRAAVRNVSLGWQCGREVRSLIVMRSTMKRSLRIPYGRGSSVCSLPPSDPP